MKYQPIHFIVFFFMALINISAQTSFKTNKCPNSFGDIKAPLEAVIFEKSFGGTESERGIGIDITSDKGYIIVGSTTSFSANEIGYVVKLDSNGSLEWSKAYDTYGWSKLSGVKQTSDGNYYLSGFSEGGFGFLDEMVIKIDSIGNIIWSKHFGGVEADELRRLNLTPDGDLVIVGINPSYGAGAKDIHAIKLSSMGYVIWAKNFGTLYEDFCNSFVISIDGNYVLAGDVDISGLYDIRPALIKIDTSGSIIWARYFSGSIEDWSRSITETPDGGYLISGDTRSFGLGGSQDIYLIKTDVNGDIEWAKSYGGTGNETGYSIILSSDNKYSITGYTSSYGAGGYDAFLMKVDLNGSVEWFHTYGGKLNDYAYDVIETPDSGYAITGRRASNSTGGEDVFLIKTDPNGFTECDYDTFSPDETTINSIQSLDLNLETASGISAADLSLTVINPGTSEKNSCVIVPVELKSFNYELENNSVKLHWATATETNNMGFNIIRNNEKIAFIPGYGTTAKPREYIFTDEKIDNRIYLYSLIQIDYDGSREKVGELEINLNFVPSKYSLEQNYPNPFNPVTKIQYAVSQETFITLSIYNSLGEKVAVLDEGMKDAGYYEVEFNGTNLSSGIYFCTLATGNSVLKRKMILLK